MGAPVSAVHGALPLVEWERYLPTLLSTEAALLVLLLDVCVAVSRTMRASVCIHLRACHRRDRSILFCLSLG